MNLPSNLHEKRELRELRGVFADRAQAGRMLADMLAGETGRQGTVLAIPAGGVGVGAALAEALDLPLDLAVVSKVTLPWNSEVGVGAVAFTGLVTLNHPLIAQVGLSHAQLEAAVARTTAKVARRARQLRGARPELRGLTGSAILVDDGLASGFTMRVAIEAVRAAGCDRLLVAVPTAPLRTVRRVAEEVDQLYCANIRTGYAFAVADAYQAWRDVPEAEVKRLLEESPAWRDG